MSRNKKKWKRQLQRNWSHRRSSLQEEAALQMHPPKTTRLVQQGFDVLAWEALHQEAEAATLFRPRAAK